MSYESVDLSSTRLRTERLLLRPWQLGDVDDFFTYARVNGVGEMAGWTPHKTKRDSLATIQTFIVEKKTLALEYRGHVIGSLDVKSYDTSNDLTLATVCCAEIGYALSKEYWGRGLMPEAVNGFLTYLFDETKLEALVCGYYDGNQQSAKVQEKCGFSFYKQRETMSGRGTKELMNYTVLYRGDWIKKKNKAK